MIMELVNDIVLGLSVILIVLVIDFAIFVIIQKQKKRFSK